MPAVQPPATETHFAPAARASAALLAEQIALCLGHPLVEQLLVALGGVAVVVNAQRQIVAANTRLLQMLGLQDPAGVLGLRPGEALRCARVPDAPSGCGTGLACRGCGAVVSMLACQHNRVVVEAECLMTTADEDGEHAWAFRARCVPLELDGQPLLLLTLQDIHAEKRLEALQQVFLHDLLNLLHALRGTCDLLQLEEGEAREQLIDEIDQLCRRLCELTVAQRDLTLLEAGDFAPHRDATSDREVIEALRTMLRHDRAAEGRRIEWPHLDPPTPLQTDRALLLRVLQNMLRNALEASPPEQPVQLWVERRNGDLAFKVFNAGQLSDEVAARIFQRFHSTKPGRGRGLGTYSMKLIGEHYLNGRVRFTRRSDGVEFSLQLPGASKTEA